MKCNNQCDSVLALVEFGMIVIVDKLHYRAKVEPRRKNKIFFYSEKEHLKFSRNAAKMVTFPCVIQLYIENWQSMQGYIFHILQHFFTKVCNSNNPGILLVFVLQDFVLQFFLDRMLVIQILHSQRMSL